MSSKYVVTRYGVLLAHSLRCGFVIQRPKSVIKTVVKIGIWSCWRQVAGVLWLYRYAYFEALISKLQKQIEEVHFTVDRAPSDWLSLSRGGGACWIVMNFFQWIDTFSHLTWFSCSETQHCMKSSHTATKQTLTNAVRQETRVWVL